MRVSAIVVTYNSEPHIGPCLAGLLRSGVDTWVVDNASSDGTVRHVRERFPDARLIVNPDNRGFARAVNQALAEVEGDVVMLVNPDCVVPPSAVRGLVAHIAADRTVGIVGPRIRDADGQVAVSAHPFESAASVVASRFGGVLAPVALRRMLSLGKRRRSYEACLNGRPAAVDWVSGACLAVRSDLLRQLGGLDTGYFMYYEDEELCLQAWRAGARVVYLPSVEVKHAVGASSSDPAHVWPQLYRSLLRFHARHRPQTYWLVRAAIVARAVIGVALGAPRDLLAQSRGRPGRRSLAWGRVAGIALRGTRMSVSRGA